MDANSEDEELANLHIDFGPSKGDLTRQCDLSWDIFASFNSVVYQLFEE